MAILYHRGNQRKETTDHMVAWCRRGGQDTSIAYSGNKVTNLASDRIQEKFGGAYILAPQCPTMWMDDGSGEYTKGGKEYVCQCPEISD